MVERQTIICNSKCNEPCLACIYDTCGSSKMEAVDSSANITVQTLQRYLLSYNSHVSPKIQGLESLRFGSIPETLAQRRKDGEAFLEKAEVTGLVEWKLWVASVSTAYATSPGIDLSSLIANTEPFAPISLS